VATGRRERGLRGGSGGEPVAGPLDDEWYAERPRQVLTGERLTEQALRHDRAVAHQQRVGEARRDLLDMVGDQHHRRGGRILRQPRQAGHEILATAQVQPGRRFVQQQ
jgi:hypothetical protein